MEHFKINSVFTVSRKTSSKAVELLLVVAKFKLWADGRSSQDSGMTDRVYL